MVIQLIKWFIVWSIINSLYIDLIFTILYRTFLTLPPLFFLPPTNHQVPLLKMIFSDSFSIFLPFSDAPASSTHNKSISIIMTTNLDMEYHLNNNTLYLDMCSLFPLPFILSLCKSISLFRCPVSQSQSWALRALLCCHGLC